MPLTPVNILAGVCSRSSDGKPRIFAVLPEGQRRPLRFGLSARAIIQGVRAYARPSVQTFDTFQASCRMNAYHLAQVNVALARAEMTSEIMSGFVSRLDEINRLAEDSKGFVWRLVGDGADATSIRAFDDPMLLVNMSVWKDMDSLKAYAYKSAHVELIRDRDAWFHKLAEAHQALWWVPAGHIPTVLEAKAKLEHIRAHGPTPKAFTFAKSFPHPVPLDDSAAFRPGTRSCAGS